ncbi:MAG: adenylate/guanylate cyclase domain-containing protein, partial [Candidatus Promineifilaceae bacterium]
MALPTGKVTFLFTDIEDSTRLWDNDPRAMESALGRHDAILQKTIEANDGQIVKATGDGFFAVFAVAVKAIAAAVDCQRRLSSEIWPEKTTIRVRMALHSGEAQVRAGDYFGADVNRAARLLSLAAGGQILLSAAAVELAGHQLPAEVALIDLGRHVLRGLYKPEHVFQLS